MVESHREDPAVESTGEPIDEAVDLEGAWIDPEDVPGIKAALTRYRVMAWVVGVLLVILVCVGMPLKYIWSDGRVVTWTGVPHGWLYAVLLITAYDLGRRVGWPIKWFLMIMAAGTVPFLSFVAEHFATKNVRERIAEATKDDAA